MTTSEDKTGRTFGHLTVLQIAHKTPKGERLWLCRSALDGQTYHRTSARLVALNKRLEERGDLAPWPRNEAV